MYSLPSMEFRVPLGWVEDYYVDTNSASADILPRTDMNMSPGRTSKTWQGFSPCTLTPDSILFIKSFIISLAPYAIT